MTTPKYYCGNKNSAGNTLSPTCVTDVKTSVTPNLNPSSMEMCFHIPTTEADFNLSKADLIAAWNGSGDYMGVKQVLIGLFTRPKNPPTKVEIRAALQPLVQVIVKYYGLGPASTSSTPSQTFPVSVKCSTSLALAATDALDQAVYAILKKVLPMIDKCIDVTDFPNNIKNSLSSRLNTCPNDSSVFVCADPSKTPLWDNKCPNTLAYNTDSNFFDTKTIVFISIIVVLLAVMAVMAVKLWRH